MAVNPTNPDHLPGYVRRTQGVDTILYNDAKGSADAWKPIAEVIELGGAAFLPDGTLYLGDSDQKTKGLLFIAKPGDPPKRLNETMPINCLEYDRSNQRLLGCSNNYHFGSIDVSAGILTPLLDFAMRRARACL